MPGVAGVTLILVASITGLYIAGEVRDIKLAQFLVQQRATPDTQRWILRAFALLSAMRQFMFLPTLSTTIVKLVMWNGSTAVEICFNAVAVSHLLPTVVDMLMLHMAITRQGDS